MSLAGQQSLLRAVAQRTRGVQFRIWGFGEGPALHGLLAAADRLSDDSLVDYAAAVLEPSLGRELLIEDHVASAEVLLAAGERRQDGRYRQAAERWAELVLSASRPVDGGPATYRPDLFGLSTTTWVDILHTHGPGLAAVGHLSDAIELVEEPCRALQGEDGLFCHGYDVATGRTNGVHWGRGCGWALLGLAGTLAYQRDQASASPPRGPARRARATRCRWSMAHDRG